MSSVTSITSANRPGSVGCMSIASSRSIVINLGYERCVSSGLLAVSSVDSVSASSVVSLSRMSSV